MTTDRYKLQEEIFQSNEERLLVYCHVGKVLKKQNAILCIVSSISPPVSISIVQLKKTDKSLKKKRTWSLAELKVVDGKSDESHMLEFDLHLDKIYKWEASNAEEKQIFIITLFKQSKKNILKDKPEFRNIPKAWVADDVETPETKFINSRIMEVENEVENEDFQAITDKEQEDLTR